jgi:general secretion pathway protein G
LTHGRINDYSLQFTDPNPSALKMPPYLVVKSSSRTSKTGWTLIELMISLSLMAVLLTVATPLAQRVVQRQKEQALRAALMQIREALDAYKRAADQGRIVLRVGDSGYPHSLTELVEGVPDQRSPSRQNLFFLRRLPVDPTHDEADKIPPEQTWGLRSYASTAQEPSEGDDVFDVYSKSSQVGLNGVPYQQW